MQRRQAQKSPQPKQTEDEKLPADSKTTVDDHVQPNVTSTSKQQQLSTSKSTVPPISNEEKVKSENAKRNLLESLSVAAAQGESQQSKQTSSSDTTKSNTSEATQEDGVSTGDKVTAKSDVASFEDATHDVHETREKGEGVGAATPVLTQRLEAAYKSSRETHEKLQKLTHMIDALGDTASLEAMDTEGTFTQVGDPIAQAALLGALSEGVSNSEDYQEAVQSTDTDTAAMETVHIVGEIVASGSFPSADPTEERELAAAEVRKTEVNHAQSIDKAATSATVTSDIHNTHVNSSSSLSDNNSDAAVEVKTETEKPVSVKKPKRQLAATFIHDS